MMLQKHLFLFLAVYAVLVTLLSGCRANQQVLHHNAMVRRAASKPRFMDSVHLNGRSKSVVMTEGLELKKSPLKSAGLAKTPKPAVSKPATAITANETPKVTVHFNDSFYADSLAIVQKNPSVSNTSKPVAAPSQVKQEIKVVDPAPVVDNGPAVSSIQDVAMQDEPADPTMSKYAGMMSVGLSEISNYSLYRFIDEWYGTEYKWGGNDLDGVDCSGFSRKLYEEVYRTDLLRTVRQQRRSCERIKDESNAAQGDLVFFRIRRLRVSHVGVYLTNGYFVHASRSHGVVISSMNTRYWQRRFAGYGRIEKDDTPASESEFTP